MADITNIGAPALDRIAQLCPQRRFAQLVNDCRSLSSQLRDGPLPHAPAVCVAETIRNATSSTQLSKVADICLDCAQRLVALGLISGSVWAHGVGRSAERPTDDNNDPPQVHAPPSPVTESEQPGSTNSESSHQPLQLHGQAESDSMTEREDEQQHQESHEAEPETEELQNGGEESNGEDLEHVHEDTEGQDSATSDASNESAAAEPASNKGSSGSMGSANAQDDRAAEKLSALGASAQSEDAKQKNCEQEPAPEESHAAAAIVDLACDATQINEETLELPIMRCLLSAVASPKIHIHDRALLRVVRAVYNIYLTSRTETNQIAARASLTQMLTAVLHRMEQASSDAPVPAIIVADSLRAPAGSSDGSASLSYVQQFLNRVVQDLSSAFTSPPAAANEHLSARDNHADDNSRTSLSNTGYHVAHESGTKASVTNACANERDEGPHLEQLRNDVFVVFRALCLQARRDTKGDSVGTKRTLLALQLLKVLLDNAGPRFCSSQIFSRMVKDHLTEPLVKNSKSTHAAAFQLSCSIFLTLMSRFRQSMKAEIGIFYPLICLSPLEASQTPSVSQRLAILDVIHKQCNNGQCLVDLFVNFDCDMGSSNLFERTVSTLVQLARGGETTSGEDVLQLRLSAMHALVTILRALADWIERSSESQGLEENNKQGAENVSSNTAMEPEQQKADKQEWQHGIDLFNEKPRKGIAYLQHAGKLGSETQDIVTFFHNTLGLSKQAIGNYIGENADFNLGVMHSYIDSIDFAGLEIDEAIRCLMSGFRIPGEAQKIDRILEKFAERYCKQNPYTFRSADTAYVLSYSVVMLNTDAHNPQVKTKMTLQDFLKNTHRVDNGEPLPNDFLTGIYNRITANEIKMRADDDESLEQSSGVQQHEHSRSNRLGLDVFLQLFPGRKQRDAGPDTSAVLEAVRSKQQNAKGEFFTATDPATVRPIIDVSWAPMLAVFSQLFDDFDTASTAMQLPAQSTVNQVKLMSSDVPLACLDGFQFAIKISARLQQETLRDAFVTSLAKLTMLQSPAAMSAKNMFAFERLLHIADEEGDYLQSSWKHVISSVSRHQRLFQLVHGYDDSSPFEPAGKSQQLSSSLEASRRPSLADGSPLDERKNSEDHADTSRREERYNEQPHALGKKLFTKTKQSSSRRSSSFPGSTFSQQGGSVSHEERAMTSRASLAEQHLPAFELISMVQPETIHELFVNSQHLTSDAVIDFVRALCEVSHEELESKTPRVYTLGKVVEFAHFNMGRVRLVWRRIWAVLSDYFVAVGKHSNLRVAMYAVDSLRQLSIKFLDRDELSKYTFQTEFLQPFNTLMESKEYEVKELVLRCMSQIVAAKVNKIRSGWKTLFSVLEAAANDGNRSLVVLAFEIVERIVREHFSTIIDSDRTSFISCVRCLVAFSKTRCSSDVSLNALAFMRFCALKLAEGLLGDLEEVAKEEETREKENEEDEEPRDNESPSSSGKDQQRRSDVVTTTFTDNEAHVHFWFPLLEGLAELAFDVRSSIRRSALDVLYDTLKFHGEVFSASLWDKVFDAILFPIFRSVQECREAAADADECAQAHKSSTENDEEMLDDSFVQDTYAYTLKLVVNLTVQFHRKVSAVWDRLLSLLASLMQRRDRRISSASIRSAHGLLSGVGKQMSQEQWRIASDGLSESIASVESLYRAAMQKLAESGSELALGRAGTEERKVECVSYRESLAELAEVAADLHKDFHICMPPKCAASLTSSVRLAYHNALDVYANKDMRRHAAAAASELKRQFESTMQYTDPPSLQVELSTGQATLWMVIRHAELEADADGAWAECSRRELSAAMRHFVTLHSGASGKDDAAERAPIVAAALECVREMNVESFRRGLTELFKLMAELMRCERIDRHALALISAAMKQQVGPVIEEVV